MATENQAPSAIKYQGKAVTVVRDANSSDQGFNNSQPNNQVIIQFADGTHKVVLRSEVVVVK